MFDDRTKIKALELLRYYRSGNRLYESVLKRHFGEDAALAATFLVNKGYVQSDYILRCPKCMREYGLYSENKDEICDEYCCNECDSYLDWSDFIYEPVCIVL